MTSARAIVRSNCVVWAIWRRIVLEREYCAAGRPVGLSPALRVRGSYLEPREIVGVKVPHFEVEHYSNGQWVREGWEPLDKRPLQGLGLLRALWAKGKIKVEVLHAGG